MRSFLLLPSAAALLLVPSVARSQYQLVFLQVPNGSGIANGVSSSAPAGQTPVTYQVPNPREGGFFTLSDNRACWWPDRNGAPVILDTLNATTSIANAVAGLMVGGQRNNHAGYWPTGVPDSFVDLQPANVGNSVVYAVDGVNQGGQAQFLGSRSTPAGLHPVLWSGSAASMVDLMPVGLPTTANGEVRGVGSGVQVGRVFDNNVYAYLWLGTAASAVNLTPATALGAGAMATDGTEHAGYAVFNALERERALVWNFNGTSYVNLNPAGYFQSMALGIRNGKQVGFTRADGHQPGEHAAFWNGTAESFVDLHNFLPAGWFQSVATGIDADGVISGYASQFGGAPVPVVWVPVATNHPPVADAGDDQELTYAGAQTPVTLDGSGSSDPDADDTLTYEWTEGAAVLGNTAVLNTSLGAGVHEITLTVTDSHGENATDTVTVKVFYSWSGVGQPINQDGSSVFKLGSTVPVKFTLTGASAGAGNVFAKLYIAKVTNDVIGTEEEAGSTSAADSGNTFRYSGGQFTYNMGTKSLTVGTWRLRIDLGDGATHTVLISLR